MAEIAAAEFSYRTQNGPGRAGDREIFQDKLLFAVEWVNSSWQ
jgi:hypothetical protein